MIIQSPSPSAAPVKMMASTAASSSSVQTWLGQELETRGVDAVVYTRYILSIFQQDSFDLEQDPELSADSLGHAPDGGPPPPPGGGGSGGSFNHSHSHTHIHHHHHQQQQQQQQQHRPHQPQQPVKVGGDGSGSNNIGGGKSSISGGNNPHFYHHHHHQQQHKALSARKEKGRGRGKAKNQHLRWQTPEDLKKDAVVKCLQSVTEKDCGIEGLVEELCLKLKKVQEERQEHATPTVSPDAGASQSDDGASQTERYYEAFPALSDKSSIKVADTKPKGAWNSKARRNNSTGSMSAPASDRELESIPSKSVSASVSRNSCSPVGFQGKQYQRAQSLPSNLSRNQNRSPTFVVPKYQGRKGHHRAYGHGHEKGSKRHHKDKEWHGQGDRGGGRYKNVHGGMKGYVVPEWYKESGEGLADLTCYPSDKEAGHQDETGQEVFVDESQEKMDGGTCKEEEQLAEAVNTMAECLCRSIMEECEDDRPISKASLSGHGLLTDEGEMYMFGSGDSLREWYAGSTRTTDCEGGGGGMVSLAPIAVDPSSIWEKNLVPGSPSCAGGQQEPWGSNARSCLPTGSSSIAGTSTPGSTVDIVPQAASDPTSPHSLLDDSAAEEASETTSLAEELRVSIDHHHLDSAPISPRNAPIGTGRNSDSLLRICDHTHAHAHAYDPQGPSTPNATGWGTLSDSSKGNPQSTPVLSGLSSEHSFSADEDSLVQGICSSQKDSSLLNISGEAHSLDMNNALWATYETKRPQIHPPKIVTWDESIFMGFQPLAKASAFIEGGVYGSPYSSHNNSQFNSCSTSPCNDSSIRELWEGSHSREASSVCSLECLLSPQPCTASCCSIQDEQSVIEDSLVDSPKYLCSRSSSRFDFARSDAENSDNSSPHGTETDEMISEDEWVDEVPKDLHEASKKEEGKDVEHSDRTPKDSNSGDPSGASPNSHQGSSSASHQGFCGSSFGSGKGTIVSQHHLSADWKQQEFPSSSLDPNAHLTPSQDRPFISTDSHFKPIQQASGTSLSQSSPGDRSGSVFNEPAGFTGSSTFAGTGNFDLGVGTKRTWQQNVGATSMSATPEASAAQVSSTPDLAATKTPQASQVLMSSGGFYSTYPGSYPRAAAGLKNPTTAPVKDAGVFGGGLCGVGAGVGADVRDPGGGRRGDAFVGDAWGCHGEMQLGDSSFLIEEDDTFLHEGLLVDQPLEIHSAHRTPGKYRKRGGTNSICKNFLEGCCTNSICGFSHDTSHVTCGQWLEGRCQSGPACKFLHGYTSNMSSQDSSRDGSRTGSTDEADEATWDHHQRPGHPHIPDLMQLPGYQDMGNHGDRTSARERGGRRMRGGGRGGGGGGGGGNGEHLRSLPINISSKTR